MTTTTTSTVATDSTATTMDTYPPDPSKTLTIDPEYRGATCALCGHYSTDAAHWYEAWSPYNYRTYVAVLSLLDDLGLGHPNTCVDVATNVTRLIDPVEDSSDNDWDIVCPDCVHATPKDLHQRITTNADRLEADSKADFGDGPEVADGDIYRQAQWVRRHIGIHLNIHAEPFTPSVRTRSA